VRPIRCQWHTAATLSANSSRTNRFVAMVMKYAYRHCGPSMRTECGIL
jgi:hypothetical protein